MENIDELIKFMEAIQMDSDFEIDIRKCSVEVQVSLMKFKLLISQKLN
jgi:hypothetical protein